MKKSFGERVVDEIAARGWNMKEAARQTGVSYDVIRELHRRPGSSTSAENAEKLSRSLGLGEKPRLGFSDVVEMMTAKRVEIDEPAPSGTKLVPVYDIRASAGHGALVADFESVEYTLAFPPDYLRSITRANPRDLAIIGVKGDSMHPTLNDDDIVMVDLGKTSLGYDGLFVLRFDGALHVKRISRSRPGHVSVISDNRANYPPVEYRANDVEVVGKVIWKGGKV